jgi:hypothetical protein
VAAEGEEALQIEEAAEARRIAEEPTAPSRVAPAARSKHGAPPSTIMEELGLIRRASQQLRAGHASDALRTLAEHRARFPKSTVATERSGLTVLAQCSQGTSEATKRAAQRFLKSSGSSPLAPHVRKQCLE